MVYTISFIIFWDFLMFYQIFLSPEVKRCAIITYKHGIYKLPHKLTNYLRPTAFSPLGGLANTRKEKDSDHRILGYTRIVPKPHRTPAQHASPRPNESPERYPHPPSSGPTREASPKRSPPKHTCPWRDKPIALWTRNRQAKIFILY